MALPHPAWCQMLHFRLQGKTSVQKSSYEPMGNEQIIFYRDVSASVQKNEDPDPGLGQGERRGHRDPLHRPGEKSPTRATKDSSDAGPGRVNMYGSTRNYTLRTNTRI
ncbi:unnamed protein product [Ranitomeya imitator]|uniref:Uncharacterized protein n=1 Tax=Ranitomeya imitator TaxID=111125 RepID=A0ABN9LWB8_9NEOB|nr:unnamed protein product [Ranitomeya imitator]